MRGTGATLQKLPVDSRSGGGGSSRVAGDAIVVSSQLGKGKTLGPFRANQANEGAYIKVTGART